MVLVELFFLPFKHEINYQFFFFILRERRNQGGKVCLFVLFRLLNAVSGLKKDAKKQMIIDAKQEKKKTKKEQNETVYQRSFWLCGHTANIAVSKLGLIIAVGSINDSNCWQPKVCCVHFIHTDTDDASAETVSVSDYYVKRHVGIK